MASRSLMQTDVEFWPLKRVVEKTGLSKSEIYRQMQSGLFPRSHTYRDNTSRRFWLSTDVRTWQHRQIGEDDFDGLLG